MKLEEQLEIEIKNQYGNIKKFSEIINIPYGTINNIIKRGKLMNSGVGVVTEIFDALGLDVLDTVKSGMLQPLNETVPTDLSRSEHRLVSNFRELNEEGQEKVIDYQDDIIRSGKYIKINKFKVVEK